MAVSSSNHTYSAPKFEYYIFVRISFSILEIFKGIRPYFIMRVILYYIYNIKNKCTKETFRNALIIFKKKEN